MNDKIRTPLFAAVLGLVCSLALAGVSIFTKPYREANEEAEKKRNFLEALNVPIEEGSGAKELVQLFEKNVQVEDVNGVTVYQYIPASGDGKMVAAAVPFNGPGLWGPIFGVMALEPDMRTVRDIRFYKHEETPGLGGEISTEKFTRQFEGRQIVPDAGGAALKIIKPGDATAPNSVDGITGATMTCNLVQAMLDNLAAQLQQEGGTPNVE